MPPAPARFSTTTACPSTWPSLGASIRMMRSGGPPGVEGTTTWMVLLGKFTTCAPADTGTAIAAAASAYSSTRRGWIVMRPLSSSSRVDRRGSRADRDTRLFLRRAHDRLQHLDVVRLVASGHGEGTPRERRAREMLELVP